MIKNYFGLFSGFIVFFLLLFFVPDAAMPVAAKRMAAIASLMAVWWITEAIPIPVTALLPIFLFPVLKIMTTASVTKNYGHHLIFLFLGGFIIALTIERWKLHKRIALTIVHIIGTNQRSIILGFMIATAFLSMWISNTATTMMMVPIGLAVISHMRTESAHLKFKRGDNNFALALMLAIAYAAGIGGIATIIGTPPNVVFLGILKSNFPAAPEISFIQWMIFALPFTVVFLPVTWLYLIYIGAPVKKNNEDLKPEVIKTELKSLGAPGRAEKLTLTIFIITGLLWLFRADLDLGSIQISGWASLLGLKGYIQDSTVAVIMAVLTFLIPSGEKQEGKTQMLMNWEWAKRLPWGILLLFGGGFALANGFQESGLTQWLGEQLKAFHYLPLVVLIIIVSAMAVFTTEFTSNTATASTLLPVLAGLSLAIEINPMILMIPATISCSTAFMLPVATPPNAIVFSSGYIRMKDMLRIGLMVNILGLILIIITMLLLAGPVFGIAWNQMPAWIK